MTALHSAFASSFHGSGPFDTMPDQASDQDWQHPHQHQHNHQADNYIPPIPMLTNQWAPHSQQLHAQQQQQQQQQHQQQHQLLGMVGMDRRYFQEEVQPYMAYSTTTVSNNLISPCYPAENTWSDMDIGTPSNFDSPQEPIESYIQTQPTHSRLQAPRLPSNSQHPHVHASSISPHQEIPDPMTVDRPSMPGRAKTDPVKSQHAKSNKTTPTIKASGSDESDDDFVPSESNQTPKPPTAASNRGRKRQRIPHTAVERRYRENLNAHLERLRQTVPALASRRTSGGIQSSVNSLNTTTVAGGHRPSEPNTMPVTPLLSDGAKPSKCEILNGAIEHIGLVERENGGLRDEIKELRTRVEDLQRWYSATLRSAGGNPTGGYAG
jgi:hypothetical protein